MARESNGFMNHSQGVGNPDQGSKKGPYAGGKWDQ